MKRLLSIVLIAVLLAGTSACGGGGDIANPVYPKSLAYDDYEGKREVRENNPVEEDFAAALSGFSYETASLLLSGQSGNTAYSPVSLYIALTLAATGAGGDTEAEMLDVLGVSGKDYLSAQTGNLYRRLYTDNEIGKLKIANSLWLQKDFGFKSSFTDNAAENFYASLHEVDFGDSATPALMGKWVSENTNGLISPNINPSDGQIMAILNTIYFKDEWIDAFDKNNTKPDTFYLSDGSEIQCDFMNMTYSMKGYTDGDGFLSASLNFKNGGSMFFVLPDEGVGMDGLLSVPDRIASMFETKEYGKVIFQIPKFSFGSELDLNDILKDLGMESAFADNADFSSITDEPAFISGISQQTRVSIDEKGVEAAAFTQILYAGAAMPNDNVAELILNRPFIFGITASDGTLLFIGVVNNPADG